MFNNETILTKIKNKTNEDAVMYEYLLALLQNESEGKNFRKFIILETDKFFSINNKKENER